MLPHDSGEAGVGKAKDWRGSNALALRIFLALYAKLRFAPPYNSLDILSLAWTPNILLVIVRFVA